jgi:hypothetical protein
MSTALKKNQGSNARRLAQRLEQLLSDPSATGREVVGKLLDDDLAGVAVPPEGIHRLLFRSLSETVEHDSGEWLVEAVELFLDRVQAVQWPRPAKA